MGRLTKSGKVHRPELADAEGADARMHFDVLGPLAIGEGESPILLRPGHECVLLAVLISNANRRVSIDRLVASLWDADPPSGARKQTQVYVHHLRKAIGLGRIQRLSAGYRLVVHPGELDADRFMDLAKEGRRALLEGRESTAAELLRQALALWRGPAYAGFEDVAVLQEHIRLLTEQRIVAQEQCIDAELRLDRHVDLIVEISSLVAEHPLRERFRAQLMVALHRAGRRAEALGVYQDARRDLASELGLEPGPELRQLEQAILNSDLVFDPVARPHPLPEVRPRVAIPAQIPATVADFVGRNRQLSQIYRRLTDNRAGAPLVLTLSGAAGVGKTTLAVRVAHRLRPTSSMGSCTRTCGEPTVSLRNRPMFWSASYGRLASSRRQFRHTSTIRRRCSAVASRTDDCSFCSTTQ